MHLEVWQRDWLIRNNTVARLEISRKNCFKKKYIVRDSKDPPKSDRYVIEENKLFDIPDR